MSQKTTTSDSNLAADHLQLFNEFTALNAFYACFCDTLADVLVAGQVLDAGTVEGVSRCSRWLKYRMAEIRTKLDAIQKQASNKTGPDPACQESDPHKPFRPDFIVEI